jgi:DNA helicase-2/ATP-dependent DNA helicase PcrA
MLNYKAELNEEQARIVEGADGFSLVLAGAGSGKTRTLTYRVAYLLEQGVHPDNILLMTFTNKASKEMVQRVNDLLGFNHAPKWAGTFHSIGNKILRRYATALGYTTSFAILDQKDSKDLFKECYKEHGIDLKGSQIPKSEVIQSKYSYARSTGQHIRNYIYDHYDFGASLVDKIESVTDLYEAKKRQLNAMDFDDLLILWLELMQERPDIKSELCTQFQYILVDEYQDTNYIQASIIRELASVHGNVLAVGDDSQSIYSFRAADIGNILNFDKQFGQSNIFKLETNYRSTPEILNLANDSIKNNPHQYKKELKSVQGNGEKPRVFATENVHKQGDKVIFLINQALQAGKSLSDIAVLFRAGNHSAELQLTLSKHGVPYTVRSGVRYFDQAHIKDLLAFARIWDNVTDELAWRRILTQLPGVGLKSAEKIYAHIKALGELNRVAHEHFNLSAKQQQGWSGIQGILQHLTDLDTNDPKYIAKGLRYVYDVYYKDYIKLNFDNALSRMDDIMSFLGFATQYDDLTKMLADLTLDDSLAVRQEESGDQLVLSTIHQAKGLEWDTVLVIGLREGSFPHFRSLESIQELEEERRLFYVAVTRAKNHLYMLYPERSFSYEYGDVRGDESMFLKELSSELYVKVQTAPEHGLLRNRSHKRSWKKANDYFDDSFWEGDTIRYD